MRTVIVWMLVVWAVACGPQMDPTQMKQESGKVVFAYLKAVNMDDGNPMDFRSEAASKLVELRQQEPKLQFLPESEEFKPFDVKGEYIVIGRRAVAMIKDNAGVIQRPAYRVKLTTGIRNDRWVIVAEEVLP